MKVTRERKLVLLGDLSGGDVAGGRGKVGPVEARLKQQHDHEIGVDTGTGGMLLTRGWRRSESLGKTIRPLPVDPFSAQGLHHPLVLTLRIRLISHSVCWKNASWRVDGRC
jgi:hypothetical protein